MLWIISKKVEARTLSAALKKEKDAPIIDVRQVTRETDQLSPAVGFEIDPPYDDEDG